MQIPINAAKRSLSASAMSVLGVALFAQPTLAQTPPGFTMERTGSEHDFEYFEGAWTTTQRRLTQRGGGANDWKVFPGSLCMSPYLEGHATVDELYFPTLKSAGLTLRVFDLERRQWAIYWVNSDKGRLDPIPVVGGFQGHRGEFYAEDSINGSPVKVRYLWIIADDNHARWEQALSYDEHTWETNWTADFTRADAADVCDRGRPKR